MSNKFGNEPPVLDSGLGVAGYKKWLQFGLKEWAIAGSKSPAFMGLGKYYGCGLSISHDISIVVEETFAPQDQIDFRAGLNETIHETFFSENISTEILDTLYTLAVLMDLDMEEFKNSPGVRQLPKALLDFKLAAAEYTVKRLAHESGIDKIADELERRAKLRALRQEVFESEFGKDGQKTGKPVDADKRPVANGRQP